MCKHLYNDDPPCDTCSNVGNSDLLPCNELAWFIWVLSSNYGRPAGEGVFPIDAKTVLELCELYDASIDDFEKVLWIEENSYPLLVEAYNKKVKEQLEKSKNEGKGAGKWNNSHME